MNTIYFNRQVNAKKPSTIRNNATSCPFCDHTQLKNIIETKGDMLLVENKYTTLKDAKMMVLIESARCDANMHTYSISELKDLLEFAIAKWCEYEQLKGYKSVALFKNKGLHSSGTIKHPHMQIVCYKEQDCNANIKRSNLSGHQVKFDNIEFNLSTLPLISFLEFNLKVTNDYQTLAESISLITAYIEETYNGDSASYNFFFYNIEGERYLKIMPRYPTSALLVGYGVVQIYDEQQLRDYEQSIYDFYVKYKS